MQKLITIRGADDEAGGRQPRAGSGEERVSVLIFGYERATDYGKESQSISTHVVDAQNARRMRTKHSATQSDRIFGG